MKRFAIVILGLALGFSALAQPKEITVKAGDISIEMVRIEPGSITLGDSTYTVDAPFYISKNLITWDQYDRACPIPELRKPMGKYRQFPVPMQYVRMDMLAGRWEPDLNHEKFVEAFADYFVKHGEKRMDVPTLAEWMLACGPMPPVEELEKYAWIDGARHGVGEKEPNANGIYDMLGMRAEMIEIPGDGYSYIGGLPLVTAKKKALANPNLLLYVRKIPMDNEWHPTFRLVYREESAKKAVAEKALAVKNASEAEAATSFSRYRERIEAELAVTRGEFEKTTDFEARKADPALQKAYIEANLVGLEKQFIAEELSAWPQLSFAFLRYDADREAFPVQLSGIPTAGKDTWYVSVPMSDAPEFKAFAASAKREQLLENVEWGIVEDHLQPLSAVFTLPDGKKFGF